MLFQWNQSSQWLSGHAQDRSQVLCGDHESHAGGTREIRPWLRGIVVEVTSRTSLAGEYVLSPFDFRLPCETTSIKKFSADDYEAEICLSYRRPSKRVRSRRTPISVAWMPPVNETESYPRTRTITCSYEVPLASSFPNNKLESWFLFVPFAGGSIRTLYDECTMADTAFPSLGLNVYSLNLP